MISSTLCSGCAVVTVGPEQAWVGEVVAEPEQEGFSASPSLSPWRVYYVQLPNQTARAVVRRAGSGAYFRLSDCAGQEVSVRQMYAGLRPAWSNEVKLEVDRGHPVTFTGLLPNARFEQFSTLCGEVTTTGYELRHLKAKFRLK
jgi:hypothetical protein